MDQTTQVPSTTPPKPAPDAHQSWPPLPYAQWRDTYQTLHRWLQMVGKVQLALATPVNHWWHITQHVTARGLTTGPLPLGGGALQIDFDFIDHRLTLATSGGDKRELPLRPRAVADMYQDFMDALGSLDCRVGLWTMPVEMLDAVPFEEDRAHASYDAEAVTRCHRVLVQVDRVFRRFRGGFLGKCSPVHLFWGAFDLVVTRFSGRPAPEHRPVPGIADYVVREAYSHECSSAGFWPGDDRFPDAAFYSYAYPQPPEYATRPTLPAAAHYRDDLGEYILPYEAVRSSSDPEATLLWFLDGTYEAAAECGGWDREALEWGRGPRQSRGASLRIEP